MWAQGSWCFKPIKSPRSNALVCAVGCVIAVPFVLAGMQLLQVSVLAAWVSFLSCFLLVCRKTVDFSGAVLSRSLDLLRYYSDFFYCASIYL